jgi:hypothetical protein
VSKVSATINLPNLGITDWVVEADSEEELKEKIEVLSKARKEFDPDWKVKGVDL